MKHIVFFLFLLLVMLQHGATQSSSLFDENHVSKIFIELPADSLQEMFDNLVNDYYYHAKFVFDDGVVRDTLENVGLRLRGNTSLTAKKKSFKISFNEYVAGREYQQVRKLNLLGSHNDPTMIREKLFYDVWDKAGQPARRGSFVQLYVNHVYRGLYANMEEIDKQWLSRAFGNNEGNLYKCTWPADLAYIDNNEASYKAIVNNPTSRAYDLTTNETEDDYSRFVELIAQLNRPVDANFATNISAILNVQSVLKGLALDVATGNWDDYFYNKNNYYLYDNTATGRFEFLTFDTDNTFGVDWLGKDWSKRNCLQWLPTQQQRPLASKLLAVPAFFNQYVHYLDSITRFVTHPDSIFSKIDYYHQLITPAAVADTYRSLDWGYDLSDFHNGFTQTIDGHTPYGIKPFLEIRYDSTLRQIEQFLTNTKHPMMPPADIAIYPNPASDWVSIQTTFGDYAGDLVHGQLQDLLGRNLLTWEWAYSQTPYTVLLSGIPDGTYRLHLQSDHQQGNWLVVKSAHK
jgi:hypothetical protein